MDDLTDSADWLLFLTGLGVDLSALTPEEAFAKGDINQDGTNNFQDFILFKDFYVQANGLGTFEAMAASVPEPTTLGLMLMGAVGLLCRRSCC